MKGSHPYQLTTHHVAWLFVSRASPPNPHGLCRGSLIRAARSVSVGGSAAPMVSAHRPSASGRVASGKRQEAKMRFLVVRGGFLPVRQSRDHTAERQD
jgi:hypothetical protein